MVFQVPLFADSRNDREGFSAHTGSSALYRDSVEIGKVSSASGLFVIETIIDAFILKP
jgi:hypothetical protein